MSFATNRRVFLKNGSLAFVGLAAFRSFGAYGFNDNGVHPIPANESLLWLNQSAFFLIQHA